MDNKIYSCIFYVNIKLYFLTRIVNKHKFGNDLLKNNKIRQLGILK